MTNKEWLENIKRVDDKRKPSDLIPIYEFRKAKALEIIAEELIKLNETVSELKKVDMLIKYGQEETRPENGDWEVRVMKDEKGN
jgi:hypothetical protein